MSTRPHDGSHLSKDQVANIEAYMRDILERLHLGYWQVHVATDLPPEDALLMIDPTDGRRIAMLYVSERWWDTSDDHRTDLVHEALHLAHHDQEECIRRYLADAPEVAPRVYEIVWGQFKTETERMVDSLSYVLAPHMPPWPGDTIHQHEWVDDSHLCDPVRRFVCTGCPDTKTEPHARHQEA